MSRLDDQEQDRFKAAVTITVIGVAGLTIAVIFLALFMGLWLDKILDSKPLFTIVLMIASIPVTIILTFRIVKVATARIQPAIKKDVTEEEPRRGEDS
jgi:F0F1-type ATP synthase assembly protein I